MRLAALLLMLLLRLFLVLVSAALSACRHRRFDLPTYPGHTTMRVVRFRALHARSPGRYQRQHGAPVRLLRTCLLAHDGTLRN
jgi:hypothetical protein